MCGVVGIYGNDEVVRDIYQGLLALQHRGQDSAGIITYSNRFHIKKGNGLVRDIFTAEHVQRLRGNIGIGHTRYPTIGGVRGEDAQPFLVNSPFGIIMAHNGNVINYAELKKTLFEKYHRLLNSDNDVEIILNIFAQALAEQKTRTLKPQHVFKAVQEVFKRVKGGYSVVAYIAEEGIVAFRDPYGIKPLLYGRRYDGLQPSYAVASESDHPSFGNIGHNGIAALNLPGHAFHSLKYILRLQFFWFLFGQFLGKDIQDDFHIIIRV